MAKISNKIRAKTDQTCRDYIDIARVMSYALSKSGAGEYDGSWVEGAFIPGEIETRSLAVWPNPTGTTTQVYFGIEKYQLSVYDVLGKELLSAEVADGVQLDVSAWESGIYLLKVKDPFTGEQYSEK